MIRNCWKARLLFGCAIWLADVAHSNLVQHVSNTPEGMLVYHGSAALFDLLLLACASTVLYGRVADDLQRLCLLSIAVNTAGWFLYLAYAPPTIYSVSLGAVGYVQYIRLLWTSSHADNLGGYMVRCGYRVGREDYYRKTHQ